ncbi:MAG: response regulator [Anaerolineae bacterium]|nr:response regulator [Anaerolineae bacterium]
MATRRILIADDDADALRLVGLMLERQGYKILAAANGQQALQKAIENQPHLIVLDVMMPDMDGYEVATRLHSNPTTESIPILMFTAKVAVRDKITGFQAGADDYLTKPAHPRELVARVEALLERHPSSEEKVEQGHIVGFLPTKGGLGTSMLALNTAIELRRMHDNIPSALVELHEGSGTMAFQLGLEAQNSLPALLEQPLSYISERTLLRHMIEHTTGLQLLFATAKPCGVGPKLDKQRVRAILKYLNSRFDYILLDLPPDLGEPYQEALRLCESILVTVEPNRVGMALAQQTLSALDGLGIGSQKARIILIRRISAMGSLSRSMVEQTLHRELIASIPPVPDLALESIQYGKPIVEIQPQSLITQQIHRVVQFIVTD